MPRYFVLLDRLIAGIVRWIIIVMMAMMTIAVFMQVLFRYLFDAPLGWSEELARFAFVWLSFLGAASLVRSDGHIRVTLLVDALPTAGWIVARVIQYAGAMVCVSIFLAGGAGLVNGEWSQLAPATQIQMGYVYLVIPVSAALMLVWIVAAIARDISTGRPPPANTADGRGNQGQPT